MPDKKRELGDLLGIILRAKDHVDWSAFIFADGVYTRVGRMRAMSVEDGLKKIFEAVVKIRGIAQRDGNREILAILAEEHEILPVHD